MKYKFPICKPTLIGDIGFIESFERKFADLQDCKYGVAVSSGTSALILALRAIGIRKEDEVIVPEFTMIATALAVSAVGATPVFVDCGDDLLIDVNLIESKITKHTKAIMPVHIYGRICDMEKLKILAIKYNLKIVEDCAEVIVASKLADISCFSFYANKILTTGEGGMCITNDGDIDERLRYYRNMCFDKQHSFIHGDFGYNFRMTNMQAEIGLAQLKHLDKYLSKRQRIEQWYNLAGHLPTHSLWVYDVITSVDVSRLQEGLYRLGIETRPFFRPMSEQPIYFDKNYIKLKAHKFSQKGLYLPVYCDMLQTDVEYIRDSYSTIINSLV